MPYRDSKLTSLLQHALGGNSITVMLACLAPCDIFNEENMSTLMYASRAQSIKNIPVVNEDPLIRLVRKLRREVRTLRRELTQARRVQVMANAMTSSGTESQAGGGTTAAAAAAAASPAADVVIKLKQDLLANIEMIKDMYVSETELRAAMESAQRSSKLMSSEKQDFEAGKCHASRPCRNARAHVFHGKERR